jgi:hypothetical protein
MSLSTDIMQLMERVAAVDPDAWESAGDSIGYGVTHQGTLDMLAGDFQTRNYDDWLRHLGMVREIERALPMGEQAKFDNAPVSSSVVTLTPQTYGEALAGEMEGIIDAGAEIGRAIVSPVTGAAGAIGDTTAGLAWKTVIPILLAVALVLYTWKR